MPWECWDPSGPHPEWRTCILLLRYVRDLTQQKIALLLGMTQVQVSRLEKKARLQLQVLLQETG